MSHLSPIKWNRGNNNIGLGISAYSSAAGLGDNILIGANVRGSLGASFNSRSIAIGVEAMYGGGLTDSVVIGYRAAYNAATITFSSVAIGSNAMYSATSGGHNIAIGENALYGGSGANLTGCVAIGNDALSSLQASPSNNVLSVAIGQSALEKMTDGHSHIAIGYRALYENLTGTGSVAIGFQAGFNNIGSDNVFIGKNSGYNEAGSDKLYIANSSTATPLIYGEFDNTLIRINGDLDVTGSITGAGATLQNAYDASTTPEIVTDATNLALTIRRGSGADTDNVFETQTGAGVTRLTIDGGGALDTLSGITADSFTHQGGPVIAHGFGTPESNLTAVVGSTYQRTDGGINTSVYVKESGVGDTGWGGLLSTIIGDTTPQLGGDLDLNSSDITGSGNINITGDVTLTGELGVTGPATLNESLVTAPTLNAAGNYTVLDSDYIVFKTGITASGDTITLPSSLNDGFQVVIKDRGGNCNGTDTITIDTAGIENIDGSATLVLNSAYASVWLIYHDTANEWSIISQI